MKAAAEVIKVFKAAEGEFFKATKEIDKEALNLKRAAFEAFNDDLQEYIKDVDFGTILEVLGDKNLSDKQKALIAAAYAHNHDKDEYGLAVSFLGLLIIS